MRKALKVKAPELFIAGAIAVGCAIGAAVGLHSLAKPVAFDQRLAAVAADLDHTTRVLGRKPATVAFPSDAAACHAASNVSAEDALKASVAATATSAGLADIVVTAATVGPEEAGLTPLTFRIEAAGIYPAAMTLIDRLAEVRPLLFLDAVDVNSKTSHVTLTISGRAYCSAQQS